MVDRFVSVGDDFALPDAVQGVLDTTYAGTANANDFTANQTVKAAGGRVPTFPAHPVNHTGKIPLTLYDSLGSTIASVVTEENNGYTGLNIFPSTDESRAKLSLWEKPFELLASGELPRRPLSIETHGLTEDGENHVTVYSNNGDGTGTASTATKVIQWLWGEQWNNTIEMHTMVKGMGMFTPDDWNTDFRPHFGIQAVGSRPVLHFGGTAARPDDNVRFLQGTGVFTIKTGATSQLDIDSPKIRFLTGQPVFVAGLRANGATNPTDTGMYAGSEGDQGQPALVWQHSTGENRWRADNRSGTLRFLSGVAAPTTRFALSLAGNVGIGTDNQFGGGVGVLSMKNAATAPGGNYTDGGVIYVQAGALKFRGSAGTVTTLAGA